MQKPRPVRTSSEKKNKIQGGIKGRRLAEEVRKSEILRKKRTSPRNEIG